MGPRVNTIKLPTQSMGKLLPRALLALIILRPSRINPCLSA